MLEAMDKDHSGAVEFEEFLQVGGHLILIRITAAAGLGELHPCPSAPLPGPHPLAHQQVPSQAPASLLLQPHHTLLRTAHPSGR